MLEQFVLPADTVTGSTIFKKMKANSKCLSNAILHNKYTFRHFFFLKKEKLVPPVKIFMNTRE